MKILCCYCGCELNADNSAGADLRGDYCCLDCYYANAHITPPDDSDDWRDYFDTYEEMLYGEGCTLSSLLAEGIDPY